MTGRSAVRGAARRRAAGVRAAIARGCAGARRAAARHHQRQGRADADRDPAFPGGGGDDGAGRARHRRRRLGRSRTLRPVPAARSAQLHPERLGRRRTPRFADWRQINAQALVTGSVQAAGRRPPQGRVPAVGRLRRAAARRLRATRRRGRTGGASRTSSPTRSTSGSPARTAISIPASSISPSPGRRRQRVKRLAIMDQDGANHQYLTDGRALVLTPRFSPSAQEITYLSYAGGTPRVYLFNIDTGQQEVDRRFPRHDLRAALLARRQPGRPQPRRERREQHLFALDLRTPPADAADRRQRDRHLAVLFAGRQPDRVQLRPRRLAAALCDERRTAATSSASASVRANTARRSGRRAAT